MGGYERIPSLYAALAFSVLEGRPRPSKLGVSFPRSGLLGRCFNAWNPNAMADLIVDGCKSWTEYPDRSNLSYWDEGFSRTIELIRSMLLILQRGERKGPNDSATFKCMQEDFYSRAPP